ncbi:MAG: hypothetical protein J5892_00185 [Bacilli bacterium]|nr:hypothetical protein [Bacilli bacterium]
MKKININAKLIKIISLSIGISLLSSIACNKDNIEEPNPTFEISRELEDGSFYNYIYDYKTKTDINGLTIINYAYDKEDSKNYHLIRIKYNNLINEATDINEIRKILEDFKKAMDENALIALNKYHNANQYFHDNEAYLYELYETYENLDLDKIPENEESIYKAIYNADNYSVVITNNVNIIGDDGFIIYINETDNMFSDYQHERIGKSGSFVLNTKEANEAYLKRVNEFEPLILNEEDLSKVYSKKMVK